MGALISAIDTERDARLVEAHRAGDLRAYAELYELHYDRLLIYCRQRIRDWHLSEEVAQETFVRAFTAMTHLRDGRRFYSWLKVIASRLAVDDFRRSGRVVLKANLDAGQEAAADESLIQLEEMLALQAAMAKVVPRHREILQLREEEGLSYDAIAEKLGTPATTIPPLLHRARSALRREFFAVSKLDRTLGIAPIATWALSGLRRWRDRGTQWLSSLPDLHGLSVPMVGVVLGMAVIIAPHGGGTDLTPNGGSEKSHSGLGFDTPVHGSGGLGLGLREGRTYSSPAPGPPSHVVGAVEITTDRRRAEWGQEQIRNMPIYFEYGDTSVGADPNSANEGLERSLAGDLGWTRGKCNDGQGC